MENDYFEIGSWSVFFTEKSFIVNNSMSVPIDHFKLFVNMLLGHSAMFSYYNIEKEEAIVIRHLDDYFAMSLTSKWNDRIDTNIYMTKMKSDDQKEWAILNSFLHLPDTDKDKTHWLEMKKSHYQAMLKKVSGE